MTPSLIESMEGKWTKDQALRIYALTLFLCVVIKLVLYAIHLTSADQEELLMTLLVVFIAGLGAYWLTTKKSPIIAWAFFLYVLSGFKGNKETTPVEYIVLIVVTIIAAVIAGRVVKLTKPVQNTAAVNPSNAKVVPKTSGRFLVWAGLILSLVSMGMILWTARQDFELNILLVLLGMGLAPFVVGLASKAQLDIYPAWAVTVPFSIYSLMFFVDSYLLFGPPKLYEIDVFFMWMLFNSVAILGSLYSLLWKPVIRSLLG